MLIVAAMAVTGFALVFDGCRRLKRILAEPWDEVLEDDDDASLKAAS